MSKKKKLQTFPHVKENSTQLSMQKKYPPIFPSQKKKSAQIFQCEKKCPSTFFHVKRKSSQVFSKRKDPLIFSCQKKICSHSTLSKKIHTFYHAKKQKKNCSHLTMLKKKKMTSFSMSQKKNHKKSAQVMPGARRKSTKICMPPKKSVEKNLQKSAKIRKFAYFF